MRYLAQTPSGTVRFSDSGMKSRSCRSVVFPALAGTILLSLVGYLPLIRVFRVWPLAASVVFPALAGTILLSLVGSSSPAATAAGKPEEPLPIGSSKQLFLGPWTQDGRDGHLVASMKNVTVAWSFRPWPVRFC